MKNKILVVVAHPDDEVLGMGGVLSKLAAEGETELHILFLSAGEASRGEKTADEKLRMGQSRLVAKKIGSRIYQEENFPDNAFDSVPLLEITKVVEHHIGKIEPRLIFTHHHGDLNIDHRITFQAVMTACRPGKTSVDKIYSFEVLSSTEWQAKIGENIFLPNSYVDIEDNIDSKIELMAIYKREMVDFPFPRSAEGIRTLAKFRGMESGLKYAEAFRLVRSIADF